MVPPDENPARRALNIISPNDKEKEIKEAPLAEFLMI